METNINKLPQKCFHKPSLTSDPKAVKRERAFELSLPALVTGLDATGKKFEERTEIYTISAQEACFWIQSRLLIGSKVLLTMEVPRTLILEKPLRLLLSGSVVFVRSEDARGRKQFVSARLDRNYKLFSNA